MHEPHGFRTHSKGDTPQFGNLPCPIAEHATSHVLLSILRKKNKKKTKENIETKNMDEVEVCNTVPAGVLFPSKKSTIPYSWGQ
jgi:hypothetical protein